MIRSFLFAGLGFAILAFSIPRAAAWDPLGHMIIAQIAADRLSPSAKAGVAAAIERFNLKEKADAPYNMVISACWMDDIRSRTKDYNPWHYVNLPFTPEGLPVPDGSLEPNVIWGLEKCEAILAGKLKDPAIDPDQALVMLLHLAGDIHQPLHTTSNDDLGGNKRKVANLKDPLVDLIFSRGGNLHFFWDSAYRRVYRDGEATVLYEAPLYERAKPVAGHQAAMGLARREATALPKKYPLTSFEAQGNPRSWALESHALGYTLAYGKLPAPDPQDRRGITLTEDYVTAARACAEERIVRAGYRIAGLLNRLYASPAPSPTPLPTPRPGATPEQVILPAPVTGNPAP